jgi:copper chaperone CopZ
MEAALKALSGSGVGGAILAVAFALLTATIGVLSWALKRLVDSAIKQQDKFSDFMDALTKSLNAIGMNCQACRSDSVATIRDLEGTLKAEVQHVVWASHDKAKLETEQAIDHAVERLEESVTGAANSIRTSNKELVQSIENQRLQERVDELSRPHDVTGAIPRPVRG